MGKKCLKCGYERTSSDLSPDYECPNCGAIYAKVEALYQKKTSEQNLLSDEAPIKEKEAANEQYIMPVNIELGNKKNRESIIKNIVLNKKILLFAVICVGFIGYIFAGPFLTISAIKDGIVENDSEVLSSHIEFPTLRQNMKDQLNASMMKNAATELKDNPFATLAAGFAAKMVDSVVDSLITPSGLASIMEGKKSLKQDRGKGTSEDATRKENLFRNARTSFDSMSKFSIWVPNDSGEEIRFVLQRYDLSWKLVNIVIPI